MADGQKRVYGYELILDEEGERDLCETAARAGIPKKEVLRRSLGLFHAAVKSGSDDVFLKYPEGQFECDFVVAVIR